MFALPNTFVGTPSRSGEKPAWVMVTVSSACAAVATPSSSAQAPNIVAMIRILGISSTLYPSPAASVYRPTGSIGPAGPITGFLTSKPSVKKNRAVCCRRMCDLGEQSAECSPAGAPRRSAQSPDRSRIDAGKSGHSVDLRRSASNVGTVNCSICEQARETLADRRSARHDYESFTGSCLSADMNPGGVPAIVGQRRRPTILP